jgi:hypothetical protein
MRPVIAAVVLAAMAVAADVFLTKPAIAAAAPGQGASAPFKLTLCKSTPAADCDSFGPSSVTLPADRSAVMETVSASCSAASSDQAVSPGVFVFSLHSTTASVTAADEFAPVAAASFQAGGAQHVTSIVTARALTIYGDAGSAISLSLDGLAQTDGAICHVTVNGHYAGH